MSKRPLVSIIMPAYNAVKFISESIVSVQQQTFSNWELIIIDDASTDTTLAVVEEYCSYQKRIRSIALPTNQGAGFARNVGIKAAEGDFIAFLDSDDLWKPEKLQVQLDFMQKHDLFFTYSSYELINEQGQRHNKLVKALEKLDLRKILKANYVGNLTGIYNAAAIGKIYHPPIRKRQDWAMWIQVMQKVGIAKGIQEPLAKYRVRKHSVSSNKIEMLSYNFQVYHKVLQYSFLKSSFYIVMFLFEQLFVKSKQTVVLDH